MKLSEITLFVYKIGDLYLRLDDDPNRKKICIPILVKHIDQASWWKNKKDAKSWYIEKEYPNAKLIPCGLREKTKKNK